MDADLFSVKMTEHSQADTLIETNTSKHTESMTISFFNIMDIRKPIYLSIMEDVPQDHIWMSLLDFDMPDSPKTLDAFKYIEEAFITARSYFKEIKTDRKNVQALEFDLSLLDDRKKVTKEILAIMKKAIEIKPAIGYLYPGIFNMLSGLRLFEMRPREDNASDTGIISLSDYRSYKRELSSFRETYAQARDAIYNIFIRPEELGIHTFSMNTAKLYQIYASQHNIEMFMDHPSSLMDMNAGSDSSWDDFLKEGLKKLEQNYTETTNLTLREIVRKGIKSMTDSNMLIRKCTLCGGYFKARVTSPQKCCSRLYRNTKTTCYEYASRKSYKDRVKEHPVYQEYLKSYNRLYARIRRNTVPADTTLADQLKDLREEYYKIYDSADPKDRTEVLEEYRNKNKELLQ